MHRTALPIILGIVVAAGLVAWFVARGGALPGPQIWVGLAVVGMAVVLLAMVVAARMSGGAGAWSSAAATETTERLGLSYLAAAEKGFRDRFRDLPEVPGNARIRHVLEGELDGRALVVFESSYMVHTGQTMMRVANSVCAVESPDWPVTHISPRGALSRLFVTLAAGSGLRLENPQFNASFSLKSDDEDFAIALLGPDMQAFMLTWARQRWRLGHGRVCLINTGPLKPQNVPAELDRMRGFWTWVPRELEAW
jgi:hypothetical protein